MNGQLVSVAALWIRAVHAFSQDALCRKTEKGVFLLLELPATDLEERPAATSQHARHVQGPWVWRSDLWEASLCC